MAKKVLKTLRQAQGLHPERSRRIKKGFFITFEGIEGCGKSTQSRLLYGHLRARGYDCVYTREPGGTRCGEKIREILLHGKGMRISDMAETFLFEAARSQIVDEIICPALAAKRIVICDRYSDATVCYQGYGGKVPLNIIRSLDAAATSGLKPDLTILLDIDVKTGLKRARKKGLDRMEAKRTSYHNAVRSGYLRLAEKNPARIRVIKVRDEVRETQALVRSEVEIVLQKYKRPG
jgi:dTMP kinase